MSWEHFVLGSADPAAVRAAAGDPAGSGLLAACGALLTALGRDPGNVDEDRVRASYPGVQTLRLPGSGLVVTVGELNILPDYFSRPADVAQAPARYLLPILQSVRAWNIRELRRTAGLPPPGRRRLAGALPYPAFGALAEIGEGFQLARLGSRCGIPPWERYPCVVARNAGHFAPFSWYRWQRFHLAARDLIGAAAAVGDHEEREALRTRARVCAGYADHFLQDSFAAGHLINKMQVMQWYAEWLAGSRFPVPDRGQLAALTVRAQPYLHGPGHYRPRPAGDGTDRLLPARDPGTPPVTDPQAALEAATAGERMLGSGVKGNDHSERSVAFARYRTFLASSVAQSAAGVLHGYFNKRSLVVSAGQDGSRYRAWGDWSMLAGAEGAGRAADAAALSRQAITDLLERGETAVSSRKIFELFPDHVEQDGVLLDLPSWHETYLRGRCATDFFRRRSTQLTRAFLTVTFRRLGALDPAG
ncbi:hypothetical protein [Trebonia sp.]|uniref:hypothetical protein n=1 Tax=Trebonia sp. TaxID=2767075 RepID=UPI0026372E81|nr:hypothetical protein [Trebonia sp.]